MLSEIVDPIIAAVDRHKMRLILIDKAKRLGGAGLAFREESGRACVNEIQSIIEPAFQAIVDAAADGEQKIKLLGDSQEELLKLVHLRIEAIVGAEADQEKGLPASFDVHYGIVLNACLDATRAVYAKMISQVAVRVTHAKPEIFISYAWGDESSEDARKRTEVIKRLCEALGNDRWNIICDSGAIRHGDLISGFMKRIGLADHVIVVLSDKYLRSPYSMTELYSIYQRSRREKEDFLRRIIPLVLIDARIDTWQNRLVYTKHWKAEYEAMTDELPNLGPADFRLYRDMLKWYHDVGEILAYITDVLTPHGFDEIVKDDFAQLRQMLSRRQ